MLLIAICWAKPSTSDDVPRISAHDAYAAVKRNDAVIVDVRSEKAFVVCHIHGARNITLHMLTDQKMKTLPKDKLIIFYCA